MVTAEGLAKLGDFGVAHMEGADWGKTHTGAVLGTLDYMAPEQRSDATSADARSDFWSLAATLYQMVTGQLPRIIRLDGVPLTLREALLKALDETPEKRYQSAGELKTALSEVAERTKEQPSQQSLSPGQCPDCGHRNGIEQRFCLDCGASLREKCLDCQAEQPIWARHCGGCGVDLAESLGKHIKQSERKRQEIQTLRESYCHPECDGC